MWFNVNAALKEIRERPPEERAQILANADVERPRITGSPNEMANAILEMLRECETLAQASKIITRHQTEIATLEATEPARKEHIENYVRYRWMKAQTFRGKGGEA